MRISSRLTLSLGHHPPLSGSCLYNQINWIFISINLVDSVTLVLIQSLGFDLVTLIFYFYQFWFDSITLVFYFNHFWFDVKHFGLIWSLWVRLQSLWFWFQKFTFRSRYLIKAGCSWRNLDFYKLSLLGSGISKPQPLTCN